MEVVVLRFAYTNIARFNKGDWLTEVAAPGLQRATKSMKYDGSHWKQIVPK
jgi:hypothetical protein